MKSGQDPAWEEFLMTLFLTLPMNFSAIHKTCSYICQWARKQTVMAIRFHRTLSPFPEGFLLSSPGQIGDFEASRRVKLIHGAAVRRFSIYRSGNDLPWKFLESLWRNRSDCFIKQQIVKTNRLRGLLKRILSNLSLNEKKWLDFNYAGSASFLLKVGMFCK